MVTEGSEEVDWLETEDVADTDRVEEKTEEIGVARRLGEGVLELLVTGSLVSSISVAMVYGKAETVHVDKASLLV